MMTVNRQIAWAAATDAGNRSMKAGKRKAWSIEDRNVAASTFERLYPQRPLIAIETTVLYAERRIALIERRTIDVDEINSELRFRSMKQTPKEQGQ